MSVGRVDAHEAACMERVVLSLLLLAVTAAGRPWTDEGDDGEDVRRAIPGEPGTDYPTLGAVPATGFTCASEGFHADPETRCQVFHICSLQRGIMKVQSFLCPNGTIFNANVNTCDWWNKVHCRSYSIAEAEVNSQLYTDTKPSQQPEFKSNDRRKFTSRRKPSENNVNLFSETPNKNVISVESNNPVSTSRGSVQILSSDNGQELVKINRRPLFNSISTERYEQTSAKDSSKPTRTKGKPFPENTRVTEVTIKPRIRYTHNLKATTDNPIYSLNPLIHLARDSSLLSTFTQSTDPIKVSHPVERYVVNDVLPQYILNNVASTKSTEPPIIQPGDNNRNTPLAVSDDRINPSDVNDEKYFPKSEITPLSGFPENDRFSFVNNGVPQGTLFNGGNTYKEPTLSTEIPDNSYNNHTKDYKKHYFINVGTRVFSPSRNITDGDYLPPVVRVTSGYRFTNTDANNYGYSTPKTVKVSNSFSVGDIVPTAGPEINTVPNALSNKESSSVSENLQPSRHDTVSSNGLSININRLQSVPDSQILSSQNSGDINGDSQFPGVSNHSNVKFINRFIVDEPTPQSQSASGYNSNGFDTLAHTTPAYAPQPVSNNYLGSSSPESNSLSGNSEWTRADTFAQPQSDVNSQIGAGYVNNIYTTPKTTGEAYNVPGHYITLRPPVISSSVANPNRIQNTEQNQKSYSSLSSVQYMNKNRNDGNFHSTTQSPESVVSPVNNNEVQTFYQQLPQVSDQFNAPNPSINSHSLSSETYFGHTNQNLPSYSSSVENLFSKGYDSLSTEIPSQDIPYRQTLDFQTPEYLSYKSVQQFLPQSGNDNILTTEKSVEIVASKEKENIFSGLQISNVLPSVEAYSWSTVVPPSSTSAEEPQPQKNSANFQEPTTTTSPLLYGNSQNSYQGLGIDKPATSFVTGSGSGVAPTLFNQLSSEAFPNSNFTGYLSPPSQSFSTTGKTTATFTNNEKEVNLYSLPSPDSVTPFYDAYTINNPNRGNFPSKSYESQTAQNGFSTEPNVFQSTLQNDYYPTKDSEDFKSLRFAFSTPEPFSQSPPSYNPQQYSIISAEDGKQYLNPSDLLRINSLHSSTELKKDVSEESAELIKSIGFSFDNMEDRDQFEIAKSKGLFGS